MRAYTGEINLSILQKNGKDVFKEKGKARKQEAY